MPAKKENSSSLFSILKGEFIADHNNQKYAPFLLMLVGLILINISISFRAERLLKESISLEEEVADLRLVYITTKSDLMSMYRRSVVEDLVSNTGLKTSLTPPIIIDIEHD
ncbi:FtsL-like putative cell division protein [Flavobacteriales bacterium]|nr:FtsL-like putative cell division protein [Flavobacteriales bacterium]